MSQAAKGEKSKSSRTKSHLPSAGAAGAQSGAGGGGGHSKSAAPPPAGASGHGGAAGASGHGGASGTSGHAGTSGSSGHGGGGGGGVGHSLTGAHATELAHDAAQAATQAGTTLLHYLEKVLSYAKADSGYTFALAGAALTVLALNLRKRI